jgi:hypothetical protein
MIFFPARFSPLAIAFASFQIIFADTCSSAGVTGCDARQVPSIAACAVAH